MTAPNVIERINEARRIIAETEFTKSGTVKGGQSYTFIPIGQILQAVRKAHAQAGVTVTFGRPQYDAEQFEKRYTYVKKGQYGETTWHAANGHIVATIYGSSVEDCIEMEVPFEAQDNSDKLTNKIITNAERCLYRVLYAIDEGDATDPEAFNFEMPAEEPPKSLRGQAIEDPFFSPSKKDIGTVAKERRASVEIPKAKQALAKLRDSDDVPTTLQAYIELLGSGIAMWLDKDIIDCYLDLQDEGVL